MRVGVAVLLLGVCGVAAALLFSDTGDTMLTAEVLTPEVLTPEVLTPPVSEARLETDDAPPTDSVATLRGHAAAPEAIPVAVGALRQAMTSSERDVRTRSLAALDQALLAGDLTLDQLFELLLARDITDPRIRKLVLSHIRAQGVAAAPLLPRVFEVLMAERRTENSSRARTATRVLSVISAGKPAEQARNALRPFLAQAAELLRDESTEHDLRLSLLVVPSVMKAEAADLAPTLVAWIRSIEDARAAYRRANPSICVSHGHHEFDVQAALSALGPKALPAIIEALHKQAGGGSFSLRNAIDEMGPEALKALSDLVSHADIRVALSAVGGVNRLMKGKPEQLVFLRTIAQDARPRLRIGAFGLMGELGVSSASDLVIGLTDSNARVRSATLRAMRSNPAAVQAALPELLEILRTNPKKIPLRVLAQIGEPAAEATPVVFDRLVRQLGGFYRPFEMIGHGTIYGQSKIDALSAFGPKATRYLVTQAIGNDAARSKSALFALERMSSVDVRDLGPLAQHIANMSGIAKVKAAGLLIEHPGSINILRKGLRDEDLLVRVASAAALGGGGVAALDLLPQLVEGLRHVTAQAVDEDDELEPEVSMANEEAYAGTLRTLLALEPQRTLPLLREETEALVEVGASVLVRMREGGLTIAKQHFGSFSEHGMIAVLRQFGYQAFAKDGALEVARPRIVGMLQHALPSVRMTAIQVVGRKTEAMPVMRALISLLKDLKWSRKAAYLLRRYGDKLVPLEAELRAALPLENETADRYVRRALSLIDDAKSLTR